MSERIYTVNETFDVLKQNKITSNIESVRRWLRNGTIEGIAPTSRKDGWKVTQSALDAFLEERLPNATVIVNESNATTVVNESLEEIKRLKVQLYQARENEMRATDEAIYHLTQYNLLHQQLLDEREQRATDQNAIEAEIWHKITRKNIWEGYVTITKKLLKDAQMHRGYSQQLIDEVWQRCIEHSSEYAKPRISYLLDAFSFECTRIKMNENFASIEEKIIYPLIEYVKNQVD